MDKIYSRKRIKVPKVKGFYLERNNKANKVYNLVLVIIIAIITSWTILKSINPIFYNLCLEQTRRIGTQIMNEESNNVLNNKEYKNIVSVVYDEKNNTSILKTDVVIINRISSDIALAIEKAFEEMKDKKIEIPIGAITGNKYLSGFGPNININVIPTGNVLTEIKTEFEEQGINQTMYRIYLELKCKVNILTPYKTIDEEIVNQVLLVETLVVGNVPQTYYNIEDIYPQDNLELIE